MVPLLPALNARGYDVAVFHTTGMGGRAFEALAGAGVFAAVMDFSLQELANHSAGSIVTAGADRLEGAGRRGVPQIVAPGAVDMIDFPAWRDHSFREEGRNFHAHNRLIASVTASGDERRRVARLIAHKLTAATGPTVYIIPQRGVEAWDREGEPMHAPAALEAFLDETRRCPMGQVKTIELDAHINDQSFAEAALAVFDDWVRTGVVGASTSHPTKNAGVSR